MPRINQQLVYVYKRVHVYIINKKIKKGSKAIESYERHQYTKHAALSRLPDTP